MSVLKVLTKVKYFVERFPDLALTYRTLRDAWVFQHQRTQLTPFGFRFKGHAAMRSGEFEPEETALIGRLLDDVDIFIDVGANVGFYTCLARFRNKHTVSIEPLKQNLDYLYANLEANNWRDVEVYPVGLAARPGLATLYGGGTGASLLRGWAGASPSFRRSIPLSTLDILVGDRFHKKMLVKIDIEGGEYDLLQGAIKVLGMAPLWIVEVALEEHYPAGLNQNFDKTFEMFWKHGYQAYTADSETRLVTADDVARWVRLRKTDFGNHNYLFRIAGQENRRAP